MEALYYLKVICYEYQNASNTYNGVGFGVTAYKPSL